MSSATVTSRGKVTIPKSVRHNLGLRAGDSIEFVDEQDEVYLRRYLDKQALEKWIGYLSHLEGQDVDELIEEMRGR